MYNSQFLRAVNNEKVKNSFRKLRITHSTAHVEFHPVPKDNRFDDGIMNYDFHKCSICLFHTMPYSWYSQTCRSNVVLAYSCFHKQHTCTLHVLACSIQMAYSWISQAPNAALS